jgi:hypothetical protein
MAVLFAALFLGLGAGVYWFVGHLRGTARADASVPPVDAATQSTPPNPFQRFIEVTGVRFVPGAKDKDQVSVRFVLVNHSEASISGLTGTVNLLGKTRTAEEDAEGSFAFSTDIGALASKDVTVPLNTRMKIYELPDWQNLTAQVRITAPK